MPALAQPSWDLYRSFLAVMQQGSLSGAARSLGLSQPTVGRHIVELQEMLGGKPLFTRSFNGLIPTVAAHDLRQPAEAMASAAASLLRAGSGDEAHIKGIVRVTASEVIGVEVLPPILARLRTAHPHIDIELELSNAVTDLLRRDADIAVRMVRPKQQSLVAKRVGRIQVGLHAHRRYLDSYAMPASVADLAQHTLIGFDRPPPYLQALKIGVALTRERFAFRADNDLAQLAAIRAGFGIGFCQYGLARRDPALVAVLPGVLQLDLETYIVMHADQRKARHIKAAFDAIHQGMTEYSSTSRA